MITFRGALALILVTGVAGCAGASASSSPSRAPSPTQTTRAARAKLRRRVSLGFPRVLAAAGHPASGGFVRVVRWRGRTAVARAQRAGVTLLSFDQHLVGLHLHSGTVDAGASGWRYGPAIAGHERRRLVAAFNGGFKLDTGSGGFALGGRTAVALSAGLGSIVTYASGVTDIGAWRAGVPAPGQAVVSVRQNLHLLVAGGRAAADVGCVQCWGATLGGTPSPARSALGITGDGHLIWAGGESLTPSALAAVLVSAGVQRAVELDINPEWVAAYLYGHHRTALSPLPIVPGQTGVPGQFLAPYSRDFFTLVAR